MLKTFRFESSKPGPVLLVTGAVHGNEKCGTIAIGRLIMEIEAGLVSIDRGTLVCVPVCNPKAYALHQRQVEANLNRVIARRDNPAAYEHHLANELTRLIDGCDIFLDLHSYSSGEKPFLFLDHDTPEHRDYARATGVADWVTGWDALYADKPEMNGGDTTSYAKAVGKTALLVECGQHEDPAAALHGYRALRGALAFAGMAAAEENLPAMPQPRIHRMTAMVPRDREGRFAAPWQHLDPVRKGDAVILYDDGTVLHAPHDGVIVMPAPAAMPGTDWLYFGVEDA